MSDLISRQAAIDGFWQLDIEIRPSAIDAITKMLTNLPSAQPEIVRCKDCIYGHLYMDVQNGVTDGWIECRNPEGLNRDVSVDGYCYASIRREERE